MTRGRVGVLVLGLAILGPTAATGQGLDGDQSRSEEQVTRSVVDRLAPSPASLTSMKWWGHRFDPTPMSGDPLIVLPQERNRAGIPFMVGGGVAFVAGVIAGGDAGTLLMLGGGGVGAYGAYVYFGGN